MNHNINTLDNKVVINYNNVYKNVEQLKKYNRNKKIIAVVKNDAYNLGIKQTTQKCYEAGIRIFATGNLTEALTIDSLNLECQVIILNPLNEEEFIIANKLGFHILIYNIECLSLYNQYIAKIKEANIDDGQIKIKFHLKVNVGMNRFGICKQNIEEVKNYLKSNSILCSSLVGLMTHFPQADEDNLEVHNKQVANFKTIYNELKQTFNFKYIHSENSATFCLKDSNLDFCNYIRVGILLYGYKAINCNLKLYPTMKLTNKIVMINKLSKGENLGYGTYELSNDKKVGICQVGYGDGIIDARKNYPVYINNKFYKILVISMSHMYIEIDDSIKIGDEVEVYGENIKFDDIEGVTNSKMMCALKR